MLARPRRARRGDIWRLVPTHGNATAPLVLIVDDGAEEFLDLWYWALALDEDVELAQSKQLVFGRDRLVLDPDEAETVRLLPEVVARPRRADLEALVGRLSPSGMEWLGRLQRGLVPFADLGLPARSAVSAEMTAALRPLVVARAARRNAFLGDDWADWTEQQPDRLVIHREDVIDGLWPCRVQLAPGLVAVVDLLEGDAIPGFIVDGADPDLAALADALSAPAATAAHDALRRLVMAEVRVSARPFSPWILDAAIASDELTHWIDAQSAAPLGLPALRGLRARRGTQALAIATELPPEAFARDHDDEEPLLATLIAALDRIADHLNGTVDVDTYRAWAAGAPSAFAAARAELERELAAAATSLEELLQSNLGTSPDEPASDWWRPARIRPSLPPATESLFPPGSEFTAEPADAETRTVRVSIPLRDEVVEACDPTTGVLGDSPALAPVDPQALLEIWVEARPATGTWSSLDPQQFRVNAERGSLEASLTLPADADADAGAFELVVNGWIRADRHDEFARIVAHDAQEAKRLSAIAADALAQDSRIQTSIDELKRQPLDETAGSDAIRTRALERALNAPAADGPRFPTGTQVTIASRVILALLAMYAIYCSREFDSQGSDEEATLLRRQIGQYLV